MADNMSRMILGAVGALVVILIVLIVAPILGTLGGGTNIQAEIADLVNNGYVVQAANGELPMNGNCILMDTTANGGVRVCDGGSQILALQDSTGTRGINLTLTGGGNQTIAASAGNLVLTSPYIADNILLSLGTDGDLAQVLSSAGVAANTALAGVLVGTPVTPIAIAANSFIEGLITASGDYVIAVNKGGTSYMAFMADASTGDTLLGVPTGQSVDFYIAGAKVLDYAVGLATITPAVSVLDATDATSIIAASLKTAGGLAVAKKVYTGEDVFFGGGGQLETVTGTLAAAGTLDLATNAVSGESWLGFLAVANVRTSAATVRTITAYAVLSRGTDAVFTSLATDNGPGGASAFTLSAPSNGVIRLTNDDSAETSARMVWLGATGG